MGRLSAGISAEELNEPLIEPDQIVPMERGQRPQECPRSGIHQYELRDNGKPSLDRRPVQLKAPYCSAPARRRSDTRVPRRRLITLRTSVSAQRPPANDHTEQTYGLSLAISDAPIAAHSAQIQAFPRSLGGTRSNVSRLISALPHQQLPFPAASAHPFGLPHRAH